MSYLKKCIRFVRYKLHAYYQIRYHYKIKKLNNIKRNRSSEKEDWNKRWSGLGIKVDSIYFDIFSKYMNDVLDIVPENICHDIIEPILNPHNYIGYYSDKNNFDIILPDCFCPETVIRNIDGLYYDKNYNFISYNETTLIKYLAKSLSQRLVIKPTVDSGSGKEVNIIELQGDKWIVLGNNCEFNDEFISKYYKRNFIIQKALTQSDYLSQFNPTSINTIRLTLYRSIKTDECHVTSCIIRIGGRGALKDNAHQGGGYVKVDLDGTLGNVVLNQWGEQFTLFNGIDFSSQHFQIPNFEKVISFAKDIGKKIVNLRLLALDIGIDKDGNPKLIEYNSRFYSMWLFQFAGISAFGDYTQEIIDYCKENQSRLIQHIEI